ncbi:hypothetical protein DPMN_154954 [Dreissena polymorpha]|uniref:Uncharacterized protein n=1 Tax=Dreissena polymorpha TaxID=45954 RepID=A0A9D4J682_DREPO|nr:hypothetical protein DPMN_154954 [Dreissena polymorpha]
MFDSSNALLISVSEDTLVDMATHMTQKVGLVHQMPYACPRRGLHSSFEKVRCHLNACSPTV